MPRIYDTGSAADGGTGQSRQARADGRRGFRCAYDPLVLDRIPSLPKASEQGLAHRPPTPLAPPRLQ